MLQSKCHTLVTRARGVAKGCRDMRPQSKARQGWEVSTGSEGEQADCLG